MEIVGEMSRKYGVKTTWFLEAECEKPGKGEKGIVPSTVYIGSDVMPILYESKIKKAMTEVWVKVLRYTRNYTKEGKVGFEAMQHALHRDIPVSALASHFPIL